MKAKDSQRADHLFPGKADPTDAELHQINFEEAHQLRTVNMDHYNESRWRNELRQYLKDCFNMDDEQVERHYREKFETLAAMECKFCGYEFANVLGKYGCPNCLGGGHE